MPTLTTKERIRALLSNCADLHAVAREADVSIRTLYRLRDTEMDTKTAMADKIEAAARRHQRRRTKARG